MRAPISETARQLLADRQATRDLKKFLLSGQERGIIRYEDKTTKERVSVQVSKLKPAEN